MHFLRLLLFLVSMICPLMQEHFLVLNHVLFRNGHLSYEKMSCCLPRKIDAIEVR